MGEPDCILAARSPKKHRHSRIHSRNLSIYFPRPDQQLSRPFQQSLDSPVTPNHPLDIPPADVIVWDQQQQPPPTNYPDLLNPTSTWSPASNHDSHTRTRRGHHHRHSLSHNFFPYLSEKESPNSLARQSETSQAQKINPPTPNTTKSFNSWKFPPSTPVSAIPKPVPNNTNGAISRKSLPRNSVNKTKLEKKITHLNMPLKILINLYLYTDLLTKVKILSALLTASLGCFFWLKAQDVQFLSLSGLGYLLVFDAIGALYRLWFEGDAEGIERVWDALGTQDHESNLKLPFGARVDTLGQFSQALYLVFSGIYIAKEAFEHILIAHPHHPTSDHSVAGTTPTDKHQHQDLQMEIPLGSIALSLLLVLFSAIVSKNHQSLTQLILPKNHQQPTKTSFDLIKINQFSALSLVFGTLIFLSGFFFSPSHLERADAFISCLMVYSIFKLAWPLASLTGKVLLQTAPLESESKTLSKLNSTLESIQKEGNGEGEEITRSILYIEPIKVWRLTIHESSLICTVVVHVKPDISDDQVLVLTEFIRSSLVGVGSEVTVDVVRGDAKKSLPKLSSKGACSHHHHDGHEHQQHGHEHHDHDHDHHHDHNHHHDHAHDHHHHHSGKSKQEQSTCKPKLISPLSEDHSSGEEDSSDDLSSPAIIPSDDHHHHHQLGHLHHSHLHLH